MTEQQSEIERLPRALITPLKAVGKSVSEYPRWTNLIGGIYNEQGQPHTESLLKRSYGQIQVPENNFTPTKQTVNVQIKKGIYGGSISNHYGHFLLESLSRAWAFKKYPEVDVYFHLYPWLKISSFADLKAWQQELLSAALINKKRLHFIAETVYFDELIVPKPGYVIQNYCSQKHAQLLTEIGRPIKENAQSNSLTEKIWLSRSLLKTGRIAGEKEFEETLEKEGFAIIHPELIPLGEQIRLFENAKVVAGFTGSAFHTLMLAENKGAKLLHFSRLEKSNKNYVTCCQSKGFNAEYYCFFVKYGTKLTSNATNVLQDLGKVWQVLYAQGLVRAEEYNDPDLEHKLSFLDKQTIQIYPQYLKTAIPISSQKNNQFFNSSTLDEIGLKYNTDKSSKWHDYLRFYEFFLSKFKDDYLTLLELGVGPEKNKGKSLLTWKDYFPNASIVGVDIRPDAKSVETDRVSVEIGDLGSLAFLSKISEKYQKNKIVIDDASHFWTHQILAFEKLFPTVEAGGIFIMEDIHTSFSPKKEQGYADCNEDAYSYFSKLAYLVCGKGNNHEFFNKNPPTLMQLALSKEIENISFYRRAIIIIKK